MKGMFELDDEDMQAEYNLGEGQNNLLIVDALNLAFRYKQQSLYDHSAPYMRTINSLASSYGCNNVVIASDWGSSKWRKLVSNGTYKSNREEMRKNQTEEEAEKFKLFFEGFEKAVELAGAIHPVLKFKGVEADDIAGYIVKEYAEQFDNIWLISSDKDWDLLLKDNVHRFSYVTRKEYTLDNFAETHGGCENPEDYVSMKVFTGDSGDGVPGFDGVGEKRAYNLIRQYGTALDVYHELPLAGNQKYIQSINSDPEKILLNYELMDLLSYCKEAINYQEKSNSLEIDAVIQEIIC
jgi:5'-3' exonuclease